MTFCLRAQMPNKKGNAAQRKEDACKIVRERLQSQEELYSKSIFFLLWLEKRNRKINAVACFEVLNGEKCYILIMSVESKESHSLQDR